MANVGAIVIRIVLPFILSLSLLLAGCSYSSDPAKVVEHYLAAKVAGDENTLHSLLCSEMEDRFEMELASFTSASDATVVDMVCTLREGQEVVDCSGKILTSYAGEAREFPLSSYRVVEESGGWKWCGEAP